jgi:hypothetical protein
MDEQARDYIDRESIFVRSLSFPELVAAIYKAYPEMRANSVFQWESIDISLTNGSSSRHASPPSA